MNELIKITTSETGQQLISARELHEFLGSKRQFADWIKERISKYEFVDGIDYTHLSQNCEGENKGFPPTANKTEYILTLDMAKELCMVENNKKGREARKYFIEVEKRYKSNTQPVKELTIYDYAQALLENRAENEKLQLQVNELKPKVQILDKLANSDGLYLPTDLAQTLGWSAVKLNKAMIQMKYIYRQGKALRYKVNFEHLFDYKPFEYRTGKESKQLYLTSTGMVEITNSLVKYGFITRTEQQNTYNQLGLDFSQTV